MGDTLRVIVELAKVAYPMLLLVVSIRGLLLWLVRQVRITDWLGYVVHALFFVGGFISLWDQWNAWGAVPAALAVAVGVRWALKDLETVRTRDDNDEIVGFFLVKRKDIPAGVRNWFG